jgi:iron complex outermembrane receptor protein
MRYNKLALAIGLLLGAGSGYAAESSNTLKIVVEATPINEPLNEPEGRVTTPPHTVQHSPAAETGELLRNLTGVSGVRMGGHGIDPVIPGLSQTRLNVLLDGAYMHGGCPNRMDPPTSYAPIRSYDSITVIKGSQTVQYGGGGSGGTVLLERSTPKFTEDKPVHAEAGYSYDSNPDAHQGYVDLAAGNSAAFIRGGIHYSEGDDYTDGDGDEVRSSYKEKGAMVTLGITPDSDTVVQFSVEGTRNDDILFAGAMMDAPKSDSDAYRFKFERNAESGPFSSLKAEAYHTSVEHVMDNYTLRTQTAPMAMRTPTTSDTWGGRVKGTVDFSEDTTWTIGVDYDQVERQGTLWRDAGGPGPWPAVFSHLWSDAELRKTGLFTELGSELGETTRVDLGVRYDHVVADLGDPDAAVGAMGQTPNQTYTTYYGITADKKTEHNVGGFVRLKQGLGDSPAYIYASASRSVRTADATERYMSKWAGGAMASSRWIGNPDLDPEKHHQGEIGLVYEDNHANFSLSGFYDRVDDYILYDRAHLQSGILMNDSAVIYRNIKAELYGAEAELNNQWGDHWRTGVGLAYVHAQNETDNRPIAQTPPLEASFSVDYEYDAWSAGALVRGAAQQNRVDDSTATGSGLDSIATAGWVTLDLHAGYEIEKWGTIEVGVKNVLDEEYAMHLNRADLFDANSVQVNEPGRSYWVNMNVRF